MKNNHFIRAILESAWQNSLIIFLTTVFCFSSTIIFIACESESGTIDCLLTFTVVDYVTTYNSDNNPVIFGIAVGDNGEIFTTTGRPPQQWIERNSGTSQNLTYVKSLPLSEISYAVGFGGAILRSTNMGVNWTAQTSGTSRNLYGFEYAIDDMEIFAVGDFGTILHSTDNGVSWQQQTSGVTSNLRSVIAQYDANVHAIAVGKKGAILTTTDGGENWLNRTFDTTLNFNSITSKSGVLLVDRKVWVVGDNGKIYYGTGNLSSWTLQNSGVTQNLNDVYFENGNSGVVVGNNGTIRLTTNGGANWFSDTWLNSLTTSNITSISKVDDLTGSGLAGAYTVISVSTEPFIGIEPISNFISEIFNLKQNYPNPFNPVTKIRFDVPANVKSQTSNVKLIIYDISGREIATVINEQLRVGQYEIEWDGTNYPSGVYFYELVAGDPSVDGQVYKETRKMVLIK